MTEPAYKRVKPTPEMRKALKMLRATGQMHNYDHTTAAGDAAWTRVISITGWCIVALVAGLIGYVYLAP